MSMNIIVVMLLKMTSCTTQGPCASGTCESLWPVEVQKLLPFQLRNVLIGRYNDITYSLSSKTDSTDSAIDDPSLKARVLSTKGHRG